MLVCLARCMMHYKIPPASLKTLFGPERALSTVKKNKKTPNDVEGMSSEFLQGELGDCKQTASSLPPKKQHLHQFNVLQTKRITGGFRTTFKAQFSVRSLIFRY